MQRQNLNHLLRPRRGLGLLEAVMALAMLAFGMLALTRMQARVLSQGADAQARLSAARMADELLGLVLADSGNAGCYVLPTPAACASVTAAADAASWKTATLAALPGGTTHAARAIATLDAASGRFQVRLSWAGKEDRLGDSRSEDAHILTVATDVRQ